jgi:hypothetical protein
MVKEQQTERLGVRVTPTEVQMLAELSELTGLGMTDVIRQAVRREYSEKFGRPLPLTKKRQPRKK